MALIVDGSTFSLNVTGDVVSKAARTASGNSGWVYVGDANDVVAQLQSDAGAGTSPTLDVKLQTSFDGTDATAIDVPNGAFTQVAGAAANEIKTVSVLHKYVKVDWTVGGVSPSFDFGVYITKRV